MSLYLLSKVFGEAQEHCDHLHADSPGLTLAEYTKDGQDVLDSIEQFWLRVA